MIPYARKLLLFIAIVPTTSLAQLAWERMDSLFPGLPASIRVHRSLSPLNGRPSVVWYVEADLRDRSLRFDTDTTYGRRRTPSRFHEKNGRPFVVVNGMVVVVVIMH